MQEKANLIWAIADKLVGVYKPYEYGNVILPMCVIKRFEDTLAPTREKVQETNKKLECASGQNFYNWSRFTFETQLADVENIKDNFESYLNKISEKVSWNSKLSSVSDVEVISPKLLETKLEKKLL